MFSFEESQKLRKIVQLKFYIFHEPLMATLTSLWWNETSDP